MNFDHPDGIAARSLEARRQAYEAVHALLSDDHNHELGLFALNPNGVNGGVIMSLATTALEARLDREGAHGDLLAFSGYFLTPSGPGPVEATTVPLIVYWPTSP